MSAIVGAIADAVAARLGARDELVPLDAQSLAAYGLEHNAVARLVAAGKLRAVRIGRRNFTRRSYLLALVDELPQVRRTRDTEDDAPERDDLGEAVAKMAARASARKHDRSDGRGDIDAA
ncbi:MAG TPA: hypothetical protein VKU41_27765 [Polyangiaceae bacterium]|nr:hypothetical protein [Polyangiaceae bacterium]